MSRISDKRDKRTYLKEVHMQGTLKVPNSQSGLAHSAGESTSHIQLQSIITITVILNKPLLVNWVVILIREEHWSWHPESKPPTPTGSRLTHSLCLLSLTPLTTRSGIINLFLSAYFTSSPLKRWLTWRKST